MLNALAEGDGGHLALMSSVHRIVGTPCKEDIMKGWRSWIGEAALRLSGPEADALERAITLALDRDEVQRTLSVDERSMLSTILTLLSRNR